MRDLKTLSKSEIKEFFNSFDQVISDIDGVIWRAFVVYPGAADCIDNIRKLGKNVRAVTNFSMWTNSKFQAGLQKNKINLNVETEIVNPPTAIAEYLKEKKFDKKVYLIGHEGLKAQLELSGFRVTKCLVNTVTSEEEFLKHVEDDEDIGAVICDFDINMNLVALQKALTYLKRKDCLFIAASGDRVAPASPEIILMWNYHYQCMLQEISGRNLVQFSKPSPDYRHYVLNRFNITQPEKVLFIGDSITEDITFAKDSGFKTLLVLSGITKIDQLENWNYSEEYKPDFYIDSLDGLNTLIKNTFTSSL